MSTATRIKRTVASYGRMLFAGLLIVSLLAFGGAYTEYANPSTETVTEQRFEQQISTSAETSAVVTRESDLYEQGRELNDMPVYFLSASPNLTINVTTSLPSDERVTVSQQLVLRQEATRNGETFWENQRELTRDEQNVTDGVAESSATIRSSLTASPVAVC